MLVAMPSAVPLAVLFVKRDLGWWAASSSLIWRVAWVAEELVSHSVATTGPDSGRNPEANGDTDTPDETDTGALADAASAGPVGDGLNLVVVRLRDVGTRVVVEVWDQASTPPHPSLGDATALDAADVVDYDLSFLGWRVVRCELTKPTPPPTRPRRHALNTSRAPGPRGHRRLPVAV